MENIQNKWLKYNYNLENQIISKESIEKALFLFNKDVLSNMTNTQNIFIFFKIKIIDGPFRNISNLQKTNKLELNTILDIFFEFWSIKNSEYKNYPIEKIVFTYLIIPDTIDIKLNNSKIEKKIDKNKSIILDNGLLDTINFGGYSLPSTMDLNLWGDCDFFENYTEAIIQKKKSKGIYNVKLYNNYLEATLKINDKIVLYFKDTLLDHNNLGSFIRECNEHKYEFYNGKLKVKSKIYKTDYIKPLLGDYYYKDKFLTMDLETRIVSEKMEVYHISIFDGNTFATFYLNDYINSDELIKDSLKYLMKRKYNGFKIYLHNFSNFDGIYLLRVMSTLSNDIDLIIKDNKIINLQFYFSNKKYYITFRDSFLLLPSSLKNLAISFNVEEKFIFPYEFVNNNNVSLDYIGKVPDFKYFNSISKKEYIKYKNEFQDNIWSLRNETIKYCNQDVKTLYFIIDKFNKKIFNLFRINSINYPTLSSLSFAIYRTIFIKDFKIPIITGELYNFFKKGYTGGAVDVYKPYGKHIFRYDVNSLYPFIMKHFPMPVNDPTFIEGDLSDFNLNQLSFIETEVESPKDLNIPLLQTRIKNNKGSQVTISPLGKWIGIYNNNEIKKAKELGYKFKFLRAVTFEKEYIFNEFVSYFYDLKKKSLKNSSDYTIAKFILNSLSGRFALDPIFDKHIIIENSNFFKLVKNYDINNVVDLENGKLLVTYNIKNNNKELYRQPNISIPISANITANARVWMYQFKNEGLYYSDTDSIDTNVLLDPKFIGDELGKLKLEHIFQEIIYLAPKAYGGISNNSELVKIKGSKNLVSFDQLKPLLFKDKSIEISQDKWLKDVGKGNITVHKEIYTLMVTDNKRQLIYNDTNKFVDTKPLQISDDKIV